MKNYVKPEFEFVRLSTDERIACLSPAPPGDCDKSFVWNWFWGWHWVYNRPGKTGRPSRGGRRRC